MANDAFGKKMVVAVVKRGNALTGYTVGKVTADGDRLFVQYTAEATPAGAPSFASPLIISVNSSDYKSVVFIENGTTIDTVKVGK